jgi:DNA polymerase IV (DinB-like DNA polymerase)
MPVRIIGHLDMDAFFAAVEERDKPRLRGKPIVVGADPEDGRGRGVVSTANYKAREYGIHSAMPISEAWRRADAARRAGKAETVFIEPNGTRYGEVSQNVMGIVRRHSAHVEQASVDEACFDLTSAGGYERAEKICRAIKQEIVRKEKLTASVGIGPNKLVAKIASDMQKPDGLTVVREEEAESFLAPLSLRKIPGIGPKTEAAFVNQNKRTIADLKSYSRESLVQLFGKWGRDIYEKIRGRDETPITEEYAAKSIGEQETFREDTLDAIFLAVRIKHLAAGVFRSLIQEGFKEFCRVVVTVRFSGFETKTRSHTLDAPASDSRTLEFEATKLFLPFLDARENPQKSKIRLVGVRVEKLA